jgi:hypothetical protein
VQRQNREAGRRDGARAPTGEAASELEHDRYGQRAEDGGEQLKRLQVLRLVTNEIAEEVDGRVEVPDCLPTR